MGQTNNLTVADWRDLYEGMTQQDSGFRDKLHETAPEVSAENVLSELELAQNRLTYAMMGVYPIYWREIELSGFINYAERNLVLYADNGERIVPFDELDPSYLEFLENQKRMNKVRDVQPLSSVALHACEEMFPGAKEVLEPVPMNTDGAETSCGVKMLKKAWERSTIIMNHIHDELMRSGAARAFGISRDDLRVYCTSNISSAQFDRSLAELADVAHEATNMDSAFYTQHRRRNY